MFDCTITASLQWLGVQAHNPSASKNAVLVACQLLHDVVAHLSVGKVSQASINVIDQQTRHLPSHLQQTES